MALSIRDSQERSTRLENMFWRIWNLTRKKKQLEGEEAQRVARRHREPERARREATVDISDLSDGEKIDIAGDLSAHGDSVRGRMSRVSSVDAMANCANQYMEKKLYIVLISLHGLIRGENMELGRDSDTGGQGVFINPAFIEPFGLTLIEAAAHGLPIVATKNGGPVDIHRVLENGLLVDPHDQHSVADALLKLVADKQLWARCRDNGLRNIHLFSWPEHYKTYLARVMSCKQRQPRWKRDEDECSESEPDSPGDSLRDIKDLSLSLKLSLDGDKNEKSGTSVTALDFVENASKKKSQLDNMVSTLPVNRSMEKEEQSNFQLSRRRKLIVIAVDCDTPAGLADVTQTIIETVKKDKSAASIGFMLSTALTITEVLSFLELSKFKPRDFDAYICNSGGEVYYPCLNSEVKSSGPSFTVDSDYQTHIDYRWGGEDLRKTIIRWEDSINDKVKNKAEIAIKEIDSASAHCFSFRINDQSLVSPVKKVRRLLRIQALRCHAIYCQSGSRLNVIPVLASRSQALRYMFI